MMHFTKVTKNVSYIKLINLCSGCANETPLTLKLEFQSPSNYKSNLQMTPIATKHTHFLIGPLSVSDI